MYSDDADVEAPPVSAAQSPPAPATQAEKVSDDTLLDSLTTLSKINNICVVQHGARLG